MVKYKYNFHTHTKRCGHAVGEDEEYVIEAIKAGIQTLGFSDHTPYVEHLSSRERMKVEDLDGYIESIEYLKEKYKDQITIRLGLEIEYFIDDIEELKEYVGRVDYAIVGQHYSALPNGFDTYLDASDEATRTYGQIIVDALDSKMVSYVAHPDLFMYSKQCWNEECINTTRMICEAAKRNHAVLELNLGGIRRGIQQFDDGPRYYYPTEKFWEIVKEYDVDIVVGVDAHNPNQFSNTESYEALEEFINKLGLTPKTEFYL